MVQAKMDAQELVDTLVKRCQQLEEHCIILVNRPTTNEAKKLKDYYGVESAVVRSQLDKIRLAEGRLSKRIIDKYKPKEEVLAPVPETIEDATLEEPSTSESLYPDGPIEASESNSEGL